VTPPIDRARHRGPVHITKALRRFVDEGLAIQLEDARSAGTLGFLTRLTALTHLPYRQLPDSRFTRRNGPYVLHIQAVPDLGLPYGRYPRLLLAWITTEAVRTRSRYLELGSSLSSFMNQIGISPHGGAHGPLGRFQDQLARLLATTFQFYKILPGEKLHYARGKGFIISDESELWWQPRRPAGSPHPLSDAEPPTTRRSGSASWSANLVLSERFFEEILEHRIPVNLRALGALKAPLAMDLYVWLTYRLHALSGPVTVPWKILHLQCGSQSPRVRGFRDQVLQKLPSILAVYPEARVQEADDRSGLVLRPSPPHIPRVRYHLPGKASR
jgi:hypothetical protein